MDRYLVGVKLIDLLHLYTMHETIEHDNDELDDITARGYASYFRRFSNFEDEEIRFVLCALLQLLY